MGKNYISFLKGLYFWAGTVSTAFLGYVLSLFDPSKSVNVSLVCALGLVLSINAELYKIKRNKEKRTQEKEKGMYSHFPNSYKIVKEQIKPRIEEKSKSNDFIDINKDIDRTIKSPLDYTHETLTGNQAPYFKPNEPYLEEIYGDDIDYIVAITAENPNLWLDPTLCFYMANCYAVSLINQAQKHIGKKMVVKDFNTEEEYLKFINKEDISVLETLKEKKSLNNFEFIRFFIFTEQQKECLEKTVFPSLKASQDLFRIKSFFLLKENIEKQLKGKGFPIYKGYVEALWDRIVAQCPNKDEKMTDIVEMRKKNTIPEFLILCKKDKTVVIHTYIHGKPYCVKLKNNVHDVDNDYEAVKTIIAYLADCRLKNDKCDWLPSQSKENLNTSKSYIDWIDT